MDHSRYQYTSDMFYQHSSNVTSYSPSNRDLKLAALNTNIQQVKAGMHQNLDKIIDRGVRIEDLERDSEDLSVSATLFKNKAKQIRRKMCCKWIKWIIIIILLLALVIITLYYTFK